MRANWMQVSSKSASSVALLLLLVIISLLANTECSAGRKVRGKPPRDPEEFVGWTCGQHAPLKLSSKWKKNEFAGGIEVEAKYFPSFAHIKRTDKSGKNHSCPAVLIGRQHVITHTDCSHIFSKYRDYDGASVTLGLGSESERDFPVQHACNLVPERILPLPNVASPDNEIMYLVLDEMVEFDENIQPACILGSDTHFLPPIDTVWDTGLVKPKQAYLVVNSAVNKVRGAGGGKETCGEDYDDDHDSSSLRLRVLPVKRTDCIGDYENRQSALCTKSNYRKYRGTTCKGDNGAPLVAEIEGRHELIGLLRKHDEICRADRTEVSNFMIIRFINHILKPFTKTSRVRDTFGCGRDPEFLNRD